MSKSEKSLCINRRSTQISESKEIAENVRPMADLLKLELSMLFRNYSSKCQKLLQGEMKRLGEGKVPFRDSSNNPHTLYNPIYMSAEYEGEYMSDDLGKLCKEVRK